MDACDSYEIALTLQPGDATLLEVVSKANKERVRDMKGVLFVTVDVEDRCLLFIFYFICKCAIVLFIIYLFYLRNEKSSILLANCDKTIIICWHFVIINQRVRGL